MFTWICPQCGREVPPSEADCPFCAQGGQAPAAAPAGPAPSARAAKQWPSWALTVLFAVGFAALGLAGYWAYRSLRPRATQATPPPPKPALAFEQPEAAGAKPHPLARHVEITGFRLSEDARRRAAIQFVVVNHSGADLSGLEAEVQLTAVSPKGDRQPVGRFSFRAPKLGPYESRELKAPLETNLRVYELPDWQFLRAEFRITAPAP